MLVVESLSREMTVGEKTYNYCYRLIKDKVSFSVCEDKLEFQGYGIEIERQDYENKNLIGIERERINMISPQRHKVRELVKVLYDNAASPVHLIDVIGEYVDEYRLDFDKDLKVSVMGNI